jgi:hypothetical protein
MLSNNRCMHGMIEGQCGICLRTNERLFHTKAAAATPKAEGSKRKKTKS